MPSITSSEEKIAVLFAVGDYSTNHIAFRMRGAYTVDWGDGNTENVADNTTAQHVYNYSDLSASTEFDYSGQTGRQAMIVITPQSGQNLTSVSFDYRHSDLVGSSSTPILEIVCSVPNATALKFGGTFGGLWLMEQCTILSHNATSLISLFQNCRSLQSVPAFDTSAVTNMTRLFSGCYALRKAPALNTASVTIMNNAFTSCFSLKSVELSDTSNVTTFYQVFLNCYSLQNIEIDTSGATGFYQPFNNCQSLQEIPALDLSGSTGFSLTFGNNFSLSRCKATGIAKTVSFQNCSLGPEELNEIYTNLADLTGLTGQTITVTGNYGTASDDPSIATNKNWTVTG